MIKFHDICLSAVTIHVQKSFILVFCTDRCPAVSQLRVAFVPSPDVHLNELGLHTCLQDILT